MNPAGSRLAEHVAALYGTASAPYISGRLRNLVEEHQRRSGARSRQIEPSARFSEQDAIVVTYPDQVRKEHSPPLATLLKFVLRHLSQAVTGVHLLPFYPSTSDDGFSVVDYRQVDPKLGDWGHIQAFASHFRLMIDAVINHVSAKSPWFEAFTQNRAPYSDYFVTVDPDTDLSLVTRPRTSALLTPFATAGGVRHVWTTFSEDQIDLNYANPDVLVDVASVLLDYAEKGADILRLDAVTYLWKELGTSCANHPNTHLLIKLLRSVMESARTDVILLTETNVPHQENIAYFGDGTDEAQMVYNFALPPLILHAFFTGDVGALVKWARELRAPSKEATFFNFLASHDGIGVRPVEDILGPHDIELLAREVADRGGLVSYRSVGSGQGTPYELNITYYDALNHPRDQEPEHVQVQRFLAAHAMMLCLAGVPGLYIHSLLGSRNDLYGVTASGQPRAINRKKFDHASIEAELATPTSRRRQVLDGLTALLKARRSHSAFHPASSQHILDAPPGVFAVKRGDDVYCLHNVRDETAEFPLSGAFIELISGSTAKANGSATLAPFGVLWLAQS